MQIFFYCYDYPDNTAELRLQHLQAHLQWVTENMASISVAGPLSEQQGDEFCGSLYVIEADSKEAATQILRADPYYKAGIWERIQVHEFKAYAGNWVGGANWPGSAT